MPATALFDINETVLDLRALDELFAEWFGDPAVRQAWFARNIHFALTLAATREYQSFGRIGLASLNTLAQERGISLPGDAESDLRNALLNLPAHPDVEPALQQLAGSGFRIAALSNNPLAALREQLQNAHIAPFFTEIISVEEAGALKPAPEVYRFAVQRLQQPPSDIWMIAAHGWDIAGALRSNLRGAFVARPGQFADPFAPPEVIANDLVGVAEAIIHSESGE